ncbi:DUF4190 domain-containing protein [Streptomyces sp. NPDC045431]|uniref:DUF4190 domain-containing protein n=1 Tax=Streptomyces sp. NPDC045431 TaxID=3155613 RepID=UPI0033EF0FCF
MSDASRPQAEYPHTGYGPGHGSAGVSGERPGRGMAIAALVTGVLSLLLFWLWFVGVPLAIAAIVLGVIAMRRARQGRATGKGMAITGLVLGSLAVVGTAILIAVGVSILNSDSGRDFQACVDKAQTESARQECADDFGRELSD